MKSAAFSLLELLITLALCAILLASTSPLYQTHIRTTYRQQTLLTLGNGAHQLDQYYMVHHTYTQASLEDVQIHNTPQAPYRFVLLTEDTSFQLQAIPQGTQTRDRCGTLSIDNTNRIHPMDCFG